MGKATAPPLTINSEEAILAVPPQGDGLQSVTLTDPATGGSTTMADALIIGAAASDNIVLLSGLNPWTPVGTQAANPVTVRVLQADGLTPVAGATVGWNATNSLQLSACSSSSSCTVTTDQYGETSTWLTPALAGAANITATLAPGVYSPSKSVSATLNANESALATLEYSRRTYGFSDVNGLANIVPSSGGFSGPLEVDLAVTAGISASLNYPLQVVVPPVTSGTMSPPVAPSVRIRAPLEEKNQQR